MRLVRRTLVYDVLRVRNAARISIASPSDFVCVRAGRDATANGSLPYCLDFAHARALYVMDIDSQAVQAAPFYYLYLRQHAQRVLSIPIESSFTGEDGGVNPVFLFSPGRCGSTLMSRVLSEAGVASVSEPDFYTQVASWWWSYPINPLAPLFGNAMWKMSQDLVTALGAPPVVKLRAECCRAPGQFVRDPTASAIMLFRGFEAWARSTCQVFASSPAKTVRKYLTALGCYAWLLRHCRCLAVRYEDWLSDPAAAALALGDFLGRPIGSEAVARALGAPSQAGTPLEARIRPGWEARWQGAMQLWHSPRLVTARDRLDLPAIWD